MSNEPTRVRKTKTIRDIHPSWVQGFPMFVLDVIAVSIPLTSLCRRVMTSDQALLFRLRSTSTIPLRNSRIIGEWEGTVEELLSRTDSGTSV